MLSETPNVRQINGEPKRRWFSDDEFDLVVWYGRLGRIIGFELCYDKEGYERAVIWKRASGYTHHRIDNGKGNSGLKPSPIVVGDGEFEYLRIAVLFQQQSAQIDRRVADFVYQKITQYRMTNKL